MAEFKKSHLYKIGAGALLVILLVRYCRTDDKPGSHESRLPAGRSPSHAVAMGNGPVQSLLDAFSTPIELYGIVTDQHGAPVPGAKIELTPVSSPLADGSSSETKVTLVTDADGKFSVTGLNGVSMGVKASKEGYLRIPPLSGPASSSMVEYADGAAPGKRYSNPATPLALVLHDIGTPEPMSYTKETRWKLPIDGTPRRISLDSENGEGPHAIEFRFKSDCLTLPDGGYGMRFDWSLDAAIPGGGFLWSGDSIMFEAPEQGYKETIHLEARASQPQDKWKRIKSGRYFVKFPDGSYGRLVLEVDGDTQVGESAITMTSWLNQKPGSRNLASLKGTSFGYQETDPEKE
ncbi:carboxypeptidase regulatory-like domain-containing protein [Luteolibacter yonseiensis]|uniref:Carboxypeptidase regulatory-like domain-containing protein n=1 Tax=Luteolibacter yonseiensis TaxID=1144680 RepID=A0A934R4M1_9BACT|nr:carboxypeptidase-like regulatory domain-containing protein [Luteolibacter yonseiensis]MBK1815089.1 carboxypeptidase regulatory-like domain-containing protein [Luteolibacter yonseiensis]